MIRWVICYDIADDRERRKVAKYLESVAERAQYSVFELVCRNPRELEEIQNKLRELVVDPGDVRFYAISRQTLDGEQLMTRPSAVIIL